MIEITEATKKKSYQNAFNKAKTTSYWKEYEEGGVGINDWSGAQVSLNALEYSIFMWVMAWYKRYTHGTPTETPVSTYDNMRYLFMELNSTAYYDLLD